MYLLSSCHGASRGRGFNNGQGPSSVREGAGHGHEIRHGD
jgi:hypothetical protein